MTNCAGHPNHSDSGSANRVRSASYNFLGRWVSLDAEAVLPLPKPVRGSRIAARQKPFESISEANVAG